jgi:hypothetical protein
MPIAPGDKVQCVVRYNWDESSVMNNVFHFAITGPGGSVAQEADVVTALSFRLSACYAELNAYLSTQLSVFSAAFDVVQWIPPSWQIFYHVGDSQLTNAPAATGDILPPSNSPMLKFIPMYRKREGRKYFGGCVETSNDSDGVMVAGLQNALMAFAADLLSSTIVILGSPSNLEAQYVILNRSADLYNTVIAWGLNENWCVQRRRKQYVGS